MDLRPSAADPSQHAEPAALRAALARLRARLAAASGLDLATAWTLHFAAPDDPRAPSRILAAGRAARPGALLRLERDAQGAGWPSLLWLGDGSPLARSLDAVASDPSWPPGPEERIAAAARLCDGVAMRLGLGRGVVRAVAGGAVLPLRRLCGSHGAGWSGEAPGTATPSPAPQGGAAALAARLAQSGAPALTAAVEAGMLVAALPPVARLDDFRELVFALDETAAALGAPVMLDGAPAPADPLLRAVSARVEGAGLALSFAPAAPGALADPAGPGAALWKAAAAEAGPMLSATLSLSDAVPDPPRLATRADAAARMTAALLARPGLLALFGACGPQSLLALGPMQADALDLALATASQPRSATPSARWRALVGALAATDLRPGDHPAGARLTWDELAPPFDPEGAACIEAVAFALLAHGVRDRAVARTPARSGGPSDFWLLPSALWPDALASLAAAPAEAPALAPWLRRAFDLRFVALGAVEAAGLRLSARLAVSPAPGVLRIEAVLEGPLADSSGLWANGRPAPLRPGLPGQGRFCGVVWRCSADMPPADCVGPFPLVLAVAPEEGGPALLAAHLELVGERRRLSAAPADGVFGPWRPRPDPRRPATLDLRLPDAP